MDTIIEIIKILLVPGSITFLMLGMTVGVVLLFRQGTAAKWGKRVLTLLVLMYWVLSTPICSNSLEAFLSRGYTNQINASDVEGIKGIVILGGGSTTIHLDDQSVNILSSASLFRVWEGARLYNILNDPLVIVSGGINERAWMMAPESVPMFDALIKSNIPEERILLESSSRNTYEQALNLRPLVEAHNLQRFILVTSPIHMRRAMATFKAQGLNPVPSASTQHGEGFLVDRAWFLPDNDALTASHRALQEIMALTYYALSGRLSAP